MNRAQREAACAVLRNHSAADDNSLAEAITVLATHAGAGLLAGGGSLSDLDDLVQDVTITVLRSLRRHPTHVVKSPGAYVRRAVHNRLRDMWRSDGSRPASVSIDAFEAAFWERFAHLAVSQGEEHRSAEELAMERIATEQLLEVVRDTLPLRQLQVVYRRVVLGMSNAETAYDLSLSESTVRTHLNRGLDALRKALAPVEERPKDTVR